MNPNREPVTGRQSSPFTGKLSARPAGKPGYCFARENLRRSLPRHSFCAAGNHPVAPGRRFQGMAESIWSDVASVSSSNQTPGRDRAASRQSAPSPGSRTCREDHALSHRPQMSSDRLFLDRVGRHQSPSPLHRHEQINTHSRKAPAQNDISTLPRGRHFYFALTPQNWCCGGKVIMSPLSKVEMSP
jgi:hypothetical protein